MNDPETMFIGNPLCEKCSSRHPSTYDCVAARERTHERILGARDTPTQDAPRTKGVYVGAPACFMLELACQKLRQAFADDGPGGIYLVGSALERPDWRDIDVRFMLEDESFERLFPNAGSVERGQWEFDPRWIIMTTAISAWLSQMTGLPVDFQFQPRSHANERHKGRRNALGLAFAKEDR